MISLQGIAENRRQGNKQDRFKQAMILFGPVVLGCDEDLPALLGYAENDSQCTN